MNLAEKAYIAGIIDGEGTVTLTRQHVREMYSPEVSVANTNLQLLLWLKEKIGGYIRKKVRKLPQHHQAYTWTVRDNRAISLLKIVEKLLIVKRSHSELITRNYKKLTPRNGKYTAEQARKKLELVAAIKKLNSR